jgi:flagellar protein FlaG
MSISPLAAPSAQADPLPVAGKAPQQSDPIVSSGVAPVAPTVQADGTVINDGSTPVSDSDASKAANALQNSEAFRNSGLSFSTDKESGLTVVTVTDSKTDQVIRQIPTKEALAMTHTIDDKLRGNLINHKA